MQRNRPNSPLIFARSLGDVFHAYPLNPLGHEAEDVFVERPAHLLETRIASGFADHGECFADLPWEALGRADAVVDHRRVNQHAVPDLLVEVRDAVDPEALEV